MREICCLPCVRTVNKCVKCVVDRAHAHGHFKSSHLLLTVRASMTSCSLLVTQKESKKANKHFLPHKVQYVKVLPCTTAGCSVLTVCLLQGRCPDSYSEIADTDCLLIS